VFGGSKGFLVLTYHQFNRLASARIIQACAGCTNQMAGDIVYHPIDHPALSPKKVERACMGILGEQLH
jgi:hypothetical protein